MKFLTSKKLSDEFKRLDSNTAVNQNMILRIFEDKLVPYQMRGNRKIVDFDSFIIRLNGLMRLDENGTKVPRLRTITTAIRDLKTEQLMIGVSKESLKEWVNKGFIGSFKIGNRTIIALDSFEEPYVNMLLSETATDYSNEEGQSSYGIRQFEELMRETKTNKFKRINNIRRSDI